MQEPFAENPDPRALRSRKALRNALIELLQEQPLEQISVRDIVARAGVGYATFFRHYPSKEAALSDIANEQITELFRLSVPVMEEGAHSAAITLLSYVDQHRSLWVPLLTGGAASAVREQFLRQARQVEAVQGDPGAWLPSRLGVRLLVSSTLELITWWLSEPEPFTVEHVAEILERTVVTPIISASTGVSG
ncbi:MAG: TetR family transcriptional regulator [Pseudomonadales bacterium]|nr:TetR family transcriptional regulator [Pseudomonadales bacterium]